MTGPAGVAVAASACLLALVVLFWAVLARRAVVRRVVSVAKRLHDGMAEGEERNGLEAALGRVEQAADGLVERMHDAEDERDRLEKTVDSIDVGLVVVDERGRVAHRNPLAAGFVGARHADALAEGAVSELLASALEGRRESRTLELYGPPRRSLVVSAFPLDDDRRAIGAAVLIEDVSERRLLEAVRRDFVANISHELKTPIGALGLLAETLAGEEDPAVSRRLAERMQVEAMRVGRIIDDLLDLSRIESEETPVREPVPVHLVLAQAVERVRAAAEHRRIAIDVQEPPRRLTFVGDRRQLVSALYNLLENAVKYSDDGSPVEVRWRTDGRVVELSVCDHGVGIPSRDLARVFERFYRVDRGRGRNTGGTGLGLAIVRHVAVNHHGEVWVDSREGEGSTFTLRLPAGPGPVAVMTEAG